MKTRLCNGRNVNGIFFCCSIEDAVIHNCSVQRRGCTAVCVRVCVLCGVGWGASILQYIFFFTVPEQEEDGELELKSIGQVGAPVQLRLSLLIRCRVRNCCHTSVLPSHHRSAACTHLLLCHFQGMGPFPQRLPAPSTPPNLFTRKKSQDINPRFQLNCQS